MSNDDIVTALVVSTHTVHHRHVANILTKLDEPTRASAVSHAMNGHDLTSLAPPAGRRHPRHGWVRVDQT